MLLLLPPSEAKQTGGEGFYQNDSGHFGELLGSSRDDLFTKATTTTHQENLPFTYSNESLPTFQRYCGVVWKHLGPNTLDVQAAEQATRSVLVVSAVGGLYKWSDPTPFYKLKVGANIHGVGKISRFWQPHLEVALSAELENGEHSSRYVIDLLALEQAAAVVRPQGVDWWRVELVGPDGRRSGHNGKAAKGRFARALLHSDEPLQLLENWVDADGWRATVVD